MAVTGKTKAPEIEEEFEEEELIKEMLENVPPVDSLYSPVKQMVRWLSKNNSEAPDGRYVSVETADLQLGEWYAKGYRLRDTHFLGEIAQGEDASYGVLYVLVRNV
jgi:hypothetical protein